VLQFLESKFQICPVASGFAADGKAYCLLTQHEVVIEGLTAGTTYSVNLHTIDL